MRLRLIFIFSILIMLIGCGSSKNHEKKPELIEFELVGANELDVYSNSEYTLNFKIEDNNYEITSIEIYSKYGEINMIDNKYTYFTSDQYDYDEIRMNILYYSGDSADLKKIVIKKIINIVQKKDLTFILYLAGDNNLNNLGYLDLLEISRSRVDLDKINVLIFTDFYKESDDIRGYIIKTNNPNDKLTFNIKIENNNYSISYLKMVEKTEEKNTGDWKTLQEVLDYAYNNYPAKQYILNLWDHGDGWYNDNNNTNPFEDEKRAIAVDDTSNGDSLNLWEVEYAIKNSKIGKLNLIYMDACLMGGVEVAYQLKDVADYLMFSPEVTPGKGSEYEYMLNAISDNYEKSMLDVAKAIIAGNITSYSIGGKQHDGDNFESLVYTVVDQRKTDVFIEKLNNVSDVLINNIDAIKNMKNTTLLTYSYENTNDYSKLSTYVDLGDFLEHVKNLSLSSNDLSIIDDLLVYMRNRDEYIGELKYQNGVYPGYPMAIQDGTYGLSIYMPLKEVAYSYSISYYYYATRFARDTKWYNFLERYNN